MDKQKQLQETAIAALVASHAKSTFLANMSNEIRTPLNGIIWYSEIALDYSHSPEKMSYYLKKILSSASDLLQIINAILDISKIAAEKMELEYIPFYIGDVLDSCVDIISVLANDKNLQLTLEIDNQLSKQILGDPTKLRQILLNLLSNAVKFTNSGGVQLKVQVINQQNGCLSVYFEVKDSGIGLLQDNLDAVQKSVHNLKGVSALIGAQKLSMVASNIESALADNQTGIMGKTGEIVEMVMELSLQLNNVLKAIEALPCFEDDNAAYNDTSPGYKTTDKKETLTLLKELMPHLENCNAMSLQFTDDIKELLYHNSYNSKNSKKAKELVSYIEEYEFEAAYKLALQLYKEMSGEKQGV